MEAQTEAAKTSFSRSKATLTIISHGIGIVSITVENGEIQAVDVSSSSGYTLLDTSVTRWIRQRWKFPGDISQTILQPVKFELKS